MTWHTNQIQHVIEHQHVSFFRTMIAVHCGSGAAQVVAMHKCGARVA